MADLSKLTLKKTTRADWQNYPAPSGVPLPPHIPGEYYGTVGDKITFEANDGDLVGIVESIALVGPQEGRDPAIHFERLWSAPYQRGRRAGASRMGDFLMSAGTGELPDTDDPQEWADAVEQAKGATVRFITDWECYDSEAKVQVAKTYKDFPLDPEHPGERLPYMEVKRPDGSTKKLMARQKIRFYLYGE